MCLTGEPLQTKSSINMDTIVLFKKIYCCVFFCLLLVNMPSCCETLQMICQFPPKSGIFCSSCSTNFGKYSRIFHFFVIACSHVQTENILLHFKCLYPITAKHLFEYISVPVQNCLILITLMRLSMLVLIDGLITYQ